MVNINQFTQMSNTIKMMAHEPATFKIKEESLSKQATQITCSDALVIETNKKDIGILDLKKIKP